MLEEIMWVLIYTRKLGGIFSVYLKSRKSFGNKELSSSGSQRGMTIRVFSIDMPRNGRKIIILLD